MLDIELLLLDCILLELLEILLLELLMELYPLLDELLEELLILLLLELLLTEDDVLSVTHAPATQEYPSGQTVWIN